MPHKSSRKMLSLLETERQLGIESYRQIPLIHIIDEDDRILLNSPDAEWFRILYYFPWKEYREIGAEYYDALYQFKITEAEKRHEMFIEKEDKAVETKEEAVERLLFSRATMQESEAEEVPIIYKGKVVEHKAPKVDPETIAPGIVPFLLPTNIKRKSLVLPWFYFYIGAVMTTFSIFPLTDRTPSYF